MLDSTGNVAAATWTVGIGETVAWLRRHVPSDALLFVDAPLVVNNASGQRRCEQQVGQRYGRWGVSANSTNRQSPRLAGMDLLSRLVAHGWSYHDGVGGPPAPHGRFVSECYPYTTIVGACELGYTEQRPRYKRQPKGMSMADFRPLRNSECDELIRRLARLKYADPPMDLCTHPGAGRPGSWRSSPGRRAGCGKLCTEFGDLRRRHDGRARGLRGVRVLVVEQQWRQRPAHVPFHVIRQHTATRARETRRLVAEQSPAERRAYKHREDLLDAALCAWTAALWSRYGEGRCQVLGFDDVPINGARPTIIAPARPEQRP